MSQVQKLRERFISIPADFTWDEMVSLLEGLNFEETSGNGSRRKFKLENVGKILLHKPHPGNIVPKYALRQVKDRLASWGLLKI